jgi:catechol 2,3-dioxygenase-like lactoylglutathione lyase family enzyme
MGAEIRHVHLSSRDHAASQRFYERYFGFRFDAILPRGDEPAATILRSPGGFQLFLEAGSADKLPAWFHFGFFVESADACRDLYQRMQEDSDASTARALDAAQGRQRRSVNDLGGVSRGRGAIPSAFALSSRHRRNRNARLPSIAQRSGQRTYRDLRELDQDCGVPVEVGDGEKPFAFAFGGVIEPTAEVRSACVSCLSIAGTCFGSSRP